MINLKVTEQIEDFNEEQCNKKFKMLYDKFIYSDDKKFKKIIENKINRFSELYKTLENKEKVDPDSLIKILTNSYGEDNIIDILNDLNKFGLIDIERCLEYVGINILIKQYREGIFTPAVIRELYDEEKIDLTDIANFINSISKNDKKYISIGALFPGEDEEDKLDRDLLTSECLIVTDDLQNEYKSNKRKKVQNDDTTKFQSEEYITDPFARLSLFQELDKNYILEMTDDGYAVVKCPIAKKVILEKLFDKNGAPYYGAATYILDMDYYRANKAYIHCDGKIVRKELTDFRKVKGVTPIAHVDRKWGRDIKNEFEVEIESQYSEEEIQKIDATIARVERSRTKRMV